MGRFLLLLLFVCRLETHRERKGHIQSFAPCDSSHSRQPEGPVLGQEEASYQKLHPGPSHGWLGPKHSDCLLLLFLGRQQETGLQVEQSELKLTPIRDTSVTCGSLTCYITMPVPKQFLSYSGKLQKNEGEALGWK